MAEIINLRRARKDKVRKESSKQADDNRVKFGEKKSTKKLREAENARSTKVFEAGKIENIPNFTED